MMTAMIHKMNAMGVLPLFSGDGGHRSHHYPRHRSPNLSACDLDHGNAFRHADSSPHAGTPPEADLFWSSGTTFDILEEVSSMAPTALTLAERRQQQIDHDHERTAHLASRESLLAPRRTNDE